MHERRTYYDLEEANAMIPRLEILFAELARIQRKVNSLSEYAAKIGIDLCLDGVLAGRKSVNPIKRQLEDRIVSLTQEYDEKLTEIHEFGVVVDDLSHGIVNFYSWFDGNEVFLSWQYGEPEIGHWHAVTENSIARRPLKKLFTVRPIEAALH